MTYSEREQNKEAFVEYKLVDMIELLRHYNILKTYYVFSQQETTFRKCLKNEVYKKNRYMAT